MNKEIFRILKEINSLYEKRTKLENEIEVENQRAAKIENQRNEKKEELDQFQTEHKDLSGQLAKVEAEIHSEQKKLETSKQHISSVFTEQEVNSLQSQINTYQENLDNFENDGLELMEKIEELTQNISDHKGFLTGSKETLDEISKEISELNQPRLKEIETLNTRVSALLSDIPEDIVKRFNQVLDLKLPKSPMTTIDKKQCSMCRFQLEQSLVDDVEKLFKFKQCSGCRRILIPISSLY